MGRCELNKQNYLFLGFWQMFEVYVEIGPPVIILSLLCYFADLAQYINSKILIF